MTSCYNKSSLRNTLCLLHVVMCPRILVFFFALVPRHAADVPSFSDIPLSSCPAELRESADWEGADFARAATELGALADGDHMVDRITLYLHRAATLPGGTLNHWLSFGRSLVGLASASPKYPLADDRELIERLASDAFDHIARGVLPHSCVPTSEAELAECRNMRALSRDVLAELVIHCDDADGALWDRCPHQFLEPLRETALPAWPPEDRADGGGWENDGGAEEALPSCDIARRSWPELSAGDFERDYNGPGVPVIVSGLTDYWPAREWTNAEPSEWIYLRLAQSAVRSLMRRAYGLLTQGDAAGTLFGVPPFRDGQVLANQYVQLDDTNLPYRQALKVAYNRPPLIQPSLLETQRCFARHTDPTDARAQRDAFHIHSRWLLVSAQGSGSAWHLDPWNTSAWNALLHGRKRWALYPPSVSGLPRGVAEATPADFFRSVLPSLPSSERPLQCVLEPGETMFLPSGWWHAVLNLERTIAITENRVDDANLHAVLEEMRAVDPTSESGRRAARMCEAAKHHAYDRGNYPRDCDERLDASRRGSPEMMDCVRKLAAAAAVEVTERAVEASQGDGTCESAAEGGKGAQPL